MARLLRLFLMATKKRWLCGQISRAPFSQLIRSRTKRRSLRSGAIRSVIVTYVLSVGPEEITVLKNRVMLQKERSLSLALNEGLTHYATVVQHNWMHHNIVDLTQDGPCRVVRMVPASCFRSHPIKVFIVCEMCRQETSADNVNTGALSIQRLQSLVGFK